MLAHFPHADLSSSICSWSSSLWEFSGRAPVASHSNRFLISTGFLFGPSENGIRVARSMALGKSTTGAQGLYGTATNSWTWPPSLYFPDIGAKPSHRIFLCAENQSVLGWHLGYGNRPGDVDGNIRTLLNMTIYVIGNCVAGYGRITSTPEVIDQKIFACRILFFTAPATLLPGIRRRERIQQGEVRSQATKHSETMGSGASSRFSNRRA